MSATIMDTIQQYLDHCETVGLSPKTVSNYRYHLAHLMAPILIGKGCGRATDVLSTDLDHVLEELKSPERSEGTRARCAAVIIQFFGWCTDRGLIFKNPARRLPIPNEGEDPLLSAPLDLAEVQALFAGLPRTNVHNVRNVAVLESFYSLGMRIEEVLNLNLEHVDFTKRTVYIEKSKHGQNRELPLMDNVAMTYREYLHLRSVLLRGPDHGAFFLSVQGTRMTGSTVYAWFKKLNRARGPDARHLYPHLFRHSIAVHLLRDGIDVRVIQHFLGHAHLDTTKEYLRLVPGELKVAYDQAMPYIATGQ